MVLHRRWSLLSKSIRVIFRILFSFGILLLLSPISLFWFIHSDAHRFEWIINGPFPFSNLGSGPFQIAIYIGLFFSGLLVTLSFLSLLHETPYIRIIYNRNSFDKEALKAIKILQRNIRQHIWSGEFPLWINIEIINSKVLVEPEEIKNNPIIIVCPKKTPPLLEVQNTISSNKQKQTCPAGSYLLTAIIRKRWWNVSKVYNHLAGTKLIFCITTGGLKTKNK